MNIEKMRKSLFESKLRAYKKHVEKKYLVNDRLQLIRFSNRKLNCLRWHGNETYEHILKKLDICIELKSLGHSFITEAIFTNGCRCDVVDLNDGIIYEVLASEKEDSCDEKIKKYPDEFRIVKVKL